MKIVNQFDGAIHIDLHIILFFFFFLSWMECLHCCWMSNILLHRFTKNISITECQQKKKLHEYVEQKFSNWKKKMFFFSSFYKPRNVSATGVCDEWFQWMRINQRDRILFVGKFEKMTFLSHSLSLLSIYLYAACFAQIIIILNEMERKQKTQKAEP